MDKFEDLWILITNKTFFKKIQSQSTSISGLGFRVEVEEPIFRFGASCAQNESKSNTKWKFSLILIGK